jgi:cysteine desulfurase
VDEAAAKIAALIGADADEIVFTSGATESNNLAVLGLGRREAGGKRRRILVSAIEHKCVLAASRALGEQCGYQIELLPVDCVGRVDSTALEEMLTEDVLLVSVMAVNNEIGTIQDIRNIASAAHKYGALFHCDAAQASCAIDLHDAGLFCDFLSLSAHKMYGPKGIGALFIRRAIQSQVEPLIYGGGQQRGLRAGTVPVPLCVGMSAAAEILSGDTAREERELIRSRRDRFAHGLKKLPWPVDLNGPEGAQRHPGNASVRFPGFSAHDILGALQPRIAASTGSACSSGIPEPSHVLRAIGLSEDEAESSIRFSIGRGTTDTDIDEAVDVIAETLSRVSGAGLAQSA